MNHSEGVKRVLVTGGGRGIGKAISLELAKQGWEVAIHYQVDRASAEETLKELGPQGVGLFQADLGDPNCTESLWNEVTKCGPVSTLVNNAGIYRPLNFAHASNEEFEANLRATMAINFESPLRLSRLASQYFLKQGGGKILNVCSRVGFKGESGACLYSASKAALINLTRSMAVELAKQNIQVFGIAPGWVETAMAREGMDNRLPEILKDIPLGRMAQPEDCASSAGFLLSQGASYLSGIVIDINGASYFH